MHASVTMGAGAVDVAVVGRPGRQRDRRADAGPLGDGREQPRDRRGLRPQPPSTKDLPDSYRFGDEHYTFSSNVRGTHHVLMTLDEESYNVGTGVTRMGADHPIAWCRMYEGARIWASSLGHFSAAYLENGGDNNLIKHLVGGVKLRRGHRGQGLRLRRHGVDELLRARCWPTTCAARSAWTSRGTARSTGPRSATRRSTPRAGCGCTTRRRKATSTLLTLQTRADHESSNDGVLGMALDPDFATNRQLYIYYSPRIDPGCNSCLVVGHNVISRFTLNAEGTAVVPGSEQEILRVPKVKVGNDNRDGVAGQNTYCAHVGGGTLSFDSEGSLYIGTGDDVDPFGAGGNGYAPMDQRYPERYDARNTSANTNDLRGKILRIKPLANATGAAGAGTTYSIPHGQHVPAGTAKTKPEIFAMGFRNPFTVAGRPGPPGHGRRRRLRRPTRAPTAPRADPAGIIEWNRVTKPGFYGWPLCTGDNSAANSYFRYTFPNGPSGARFDCAATRRSRTSRPTTAV